MRTGFTVSAIAHTTLLVLAVVGLGFAEPYKPEVVESISVDLVPIEEFSNIRAGSLDSTIVETETPSVVEDVKEAKLAQPTGNTQEDQPTPEDTPVPTPAPTQQTAPAPTPQAEPEPVITPDPEPAPVPETRPEPEPEPDPTPVVEPTPVATPEKPVTPAEVAPKPAVRTASLDQKRAEFKKQQEAEKKKKEDEAKKKKAEEAKRIEEAKLKEDEAAKLADEVANIINTEESRGATTGEGGQATLGKESGKAARLSQSEMDALVAQIRDCPYYNPPLGAAEAGVTAQLRFNIDGNGNVIANPQVVAADDSQLGRALASAAQRGVMRCGPYLMAVGQDVQAAFDPRLM